MRCESFWQWAQSVHSPNIAPSLSSWKVASVSRRAEVALRMLVLKHVRNWSYEALEWEVTGNLVYRYFCRIGGGKVPDAKTMVRLGQLLTGERLRAIFERVVCQARERRVTRGRGRD